MKWCVSFAILYFGVRSKASKKQGPTGYWEAAAFEVETEECDDAGLGNPGQAMHMAREMAKQAFEETPKYLTVGPVLQCKRVEPDLKEANRVDL